MDMNTPTKLVITKGKITMLDGSDATNYLKKWMRDHNLKDGEFVNVLSHETAKDWEQTVWESRNLMIAA